jgi:3'-phosphoadenosine 5'-phosphosulfate (PAPS) 3'-phosphatase
MPYREELDAAVAAARAGGAIVMEYYVRANLGKYEKIDGSPVTDADLAADHVIRELLASRFPDDPILTEEGHDDQRRHGNARCWIVDPVDGTEQFIERTGEFDVLVALVEDGRPVAVAGYQPTTQTMVTATRGGGAAVAIGDESPRPVRLEPAVDPPRIATSKWFGAPGNASILREVAKRLAVPPGPSLMTGFTPRMFLAPRAFDAMIGIRDSDDQTMASEWDFAVADLVIAEAGGIVTDLDGQPFRYNKPVPLNVGGLVAATDARTHATVLEALRPHWQHLQRNPVAR